MLIVLIGVRNINKLHESDYSLGSLEPAVTFYDILSFMSNVGLSCMMIYLFRT